MKSTKVMFLSLTVVMSGLTAATVSIDATGPVPELRLYEEAPGSSGPSEVIEIMRDSGIAQHQFGINSDYYRGRHIFAELGIGKRNSLTFRGIDPKTVVTSSVGSFSTVTFDGPSAEELFSFLLTSPDAKKSTQLGSATIRTRHVSCVRAVDGQPAVTKCSLLVAPLL